jgi:hypothetical protein
VQLDRESTDPEKDSYTSIDDDFVALMLFCWEFNTHTSCIGYFSVVCSAKNES